MKSTETRPTRRGARALLLALCAALVASTFGCASAQKTAPHMGIGGLEIEADFDRSDLVVMDTVIGESSTTSILFGLIQIIDEDKVSILGLKTFTDKYTYFNSDPGFIGSIARIFGAGPADRAYYKALEKAADADFVLVKSMDREDSGIPIFASTQTVTWRGKAMRLKADR